MPVARSAKRWLAPAAKTLAPRLFWRRKYGIVQRLSESRPDVQLVASLCDPNRVSLDIGADVGEFTIAMLASSRSVIAFEPRPARNPGIPIRSSTSATVRPSTPGVRDPALPATRSNATINVAGSYTKLNRSSNLRPGSAAAQR
jgi:hypothetical protein